MHAAARRHKTNRSCAFDVFDVSEESFNGEKAISLMLWSIRLVTGLRENKDRFLEPPSNSNSFGVPKNFSVKSNYNSNFASTISDPLSF